MTTQGLENRTLAECALASARLFEAQQWKWSSKPYAPDNLHVPDAERILEMLQGLFCSAMDAAGSGEGSSSRSGRLRVDVCSDDCARSCEVRCVQIWQQLGEIEVAEEAAS